MALIRCEGIHFRHGSTPILTDLDLTVPDGQVTVLVGRSGSGKTTVLRLIAGFDAPERGEISIGGEPVSRDGRTLAPPEARGVGMVFQDLALWPHMTVRRTLDFVLGPAVRPAERRGRIDETLAAVGLADRGAARPADLSGGERQRVALARAIVTRPRILLMDEPLSSLEAPLRHALGDEVRRLQARFGLTILYVTHDREETFTLGDHAAVLRAGRIEQRGTPREMYERPRSAFVASLLGPCALIPARRDGDRLESPLGPLPVIGEGSPGGDVSVVVRPEDVIARERGPFSGRVDRAVWVGGRLQAELSGEGWRLLALLDEDRKPGTVVSFSVRRAVAVPREGSFSG